eukprot:CAMPEP_0197074436 /NCGR_PEP_ID=MMETSP1384-20130603/211108_1 /TAXON_ID=29189 /ORGANISM="Ammonia sp." /LENGTH=471 /DNA_ID=CAMNT_0042513277 /DNA_START=39 /DNA_END=1454 /DNA_ORIENTATION=+
MAELSIAALQSTTTRLSKKRLSAMTLPDLQQTISDLDKLVHRNEDDNDKENSNEDAKQKQLQRIKMQIKQKQCALKSIEKEMEQYFEARKEIIVSNERLTSELHELRGDFNAEMYKTENIKLLLAQNTQNEKNSNSDHQAQENEDSEDRVTEIEKLRRKHSALFARIQHSFYTHNDAANANSNDHQNIDELLSEKRKLTQQLHELQCEYERVQSEQSKTCLERKLGSELLSILSSIESERAGQRQREESVSASIVNRKKQQINAEIVAEKRRRQRETLSEKLESIELELQQYACANTYGSPSMSMRNSVTSLGSLDAQSLMSDSSQQHFDVSELKQTASNLVQYLQDFLPLAMRKQVESIKMKMSEQIGEQQMNEIEAVLREMTVELQSKQQFANTHNRAYPDYIDSMTSNGGAAQQQQYFYLNHSMNIFDEFEKLEIKIPLIVSDIPHTLRTLWDRLQNLQHMNKFFAVV